MKKSVLITGISGFIAKQVALEALNSGYQVRGTVRSETRKDEVTSSLKEAGADTAKLEIIQADLLNDTGWQKAFEGIDYLLHLASPFPMQQPKDREALVPEAKEGTLRVLNHAQDAGVKKIVLTSSMVAMMYQDKRSAEFPVGEHSWTQVEWPKLSAYIVSKTRAEQAAWQWARDNNFLEKLCTVNPGLVLGPAVDTRIGTSLQVIQLILKGTYPALPPVHFPIVDVRDLARLHILALEAKESGGRRLMAANETWKMKELALHLKKVFPEHSSKVPKGELPAAVIKALSLFDKTMKSVTADLGVKPIAKSAYVTELTGLKFRPTTETIDDTVKFLLENKLV